MGDFDISDATVKLSGRNIHDPNIVSYDVNIIAHVDGGPNAYVTIGTIVQRQANDEATRLHAINEAKRLARQLIELPAERFKSA